MLENYQMTSGEWAAWVQAVGSVLAIIAAAVIARLQHRNDVALQRAQEQRALLATAKTLLALSQNSAVAMRYVANQLKDRQAVVDVAEGVARCAVDELVRIDRYLGQVPLHSLPAALVTLTMILASSVYQFKEKVAMALRLHRQMDANAFDDFFRTLNEMTESVNATCADIAKEAERMSAQN